MSAQASAVITSTTPLWYATRATGVTGQCGPCLNGLPALAGALETLAGAGGEGAVRTLQSLMPFVERRGACRHPDGAVRLIASALRVFAADPVRRPRTVYRGIAGTAERGSPGSSRPARRAHSRATARPRAARRRRLPDPRPRAHPGRALRPAPLRRGGCATGLSACTDVADCQRHRYPPTCGGYTGSRVLYAFRTMRPLSVL
jgi:hypothetical protein